MLQPLTFDQLSDAELRLVEIDRDNYAAVLALRVAAGQEAFVRNNAVSLVQSRYHRAAWPRAIYAKDRPVGFVMLHDPRQAEPDAASSGDFLVPDGRVPGDGLFVWRLMIDSGQQGKGLGRRVIGLLGEVARANGFDRLYLSYVDTAEGPGAFYAACGFRETGRRIDGEAEAVLDLSR